MKNKYFNFWFGGSRPIFMYAPLETELVKLNFRKGENNGIDLTSDINANSLKKLGIGWTMLFGFNIEKLNNDKDFSAIFSHSNNGCFQFIINDLKDESKNPSFQFRKTGAPGNSNTFYTKFIPQEDFM